jgi:TPR repeat protein
MKTAHILTLLPFVVVSLFAKPSWEEKSLEQVLSHIRTLEIETFEDLVAKAEGGDWVAQFGLGYFYGEGMGVPKDHGKAIHWLRRSAEGGEPWIQGYVGALYLTGQWVEVDYREAINWLGGAAKTGFGPAQAAVGSMYVLGQGVPRDYVLAYKWLNLALGVGYEEAGEGLDALSAQMTPMQIEEGQRLSRKWIEEKVTTR